MTEQKEGKRRGRQEKCEIGEACDIARECNTLATEQSAEFEAKALLLLSHRLSHFFLHYLSLEIHPSANASFVADPLFCGA
jgi:hypothetical protein